MNEPKSARYQRLKRRAAYAAAGLRGLLLVSLAVTGMSAWLRDLSGGSTALYALLLGLMLEGISGPFRWYRLHYLDRMYGLAREPLGAWLRQYAKDASVLLAAAIPVVVLCYAAMRAWPRWWWVAAAGVCAVAMMLLALAAPAVVPVLRRSRPLASAVLAQRLMDLAARAGVDVVDVHELGAGPNARRASASLVGAGPLRRILLSDTLLLEYSDDEIEVLLAHELAHHAHGDVLKGMAAELVVVCAALAASHVALNASWARLGWTSPSDVAGLPVLLAVFGAVSLLARPLLNAWSRRIERRADEFALAHASRPDAFTAAVRRMAAQNLVEERPTRAALWMFHAHPPVDERLAAARAWLAARQKGSAGCAT